MRAVASGVYKITNAVNGHVYVGSAVDFDRRWGEHRKMLRAGNHRNRYLQAAWNKYGEPAFAFEPIYECEPQDLLAAEQAHIDTTAEERGWNALYNLSPKAGSALGVRWSKESRERLSAAQRGQPGRHTKPHTEESRRKMSLAHRNMSDETRRKMSAAKTGKKRKPFTQETLRRMSEAQKGKPIPERLRRLWSEQRRGVSWGMKRRAADYAKRYVII